MTQRSPSQTIGPFFHLGLRWRDGGKVAFSPRGDRVVLAGRILDGAGKAVGDALVETWQAPPKGAKGTARGKSNPFGFGRVETGKDGRFRIETSMPAGDAPAIEVAIFARGLLKPLRTRVYLAPRAKVEADLQMKPLAGSKRLETLIARHSGGAEYRWDVRLQGDGETVFFAT
jgi:protocatechuate 3,4-dioxygenase alpha subunit